MRSIHFCSAIRFVVVLALSAAWSEADEPPQPQWGAIARSGPGTLVATINTPETDGVLQLPTPFPHLVAVRRADGAAVEFEFNADASELKLLGQPNERGAIELETAAKTEQFADGRIVLHAADAKIDGAAARLESHPGNDRIGFWTNANDRVSWKFPATREGMYTVRLTYSTASPDGTEVEVHVGEQKVAEMLRSTGSWYRYTSLDLGTVYVPKSGELVIDVRCKKLIGPAVMNFKAVTLVPACEGESPRQQACGEVVLHARDATVHGTMLRNETSPKKLTLGYWVAASDTASWDFVVDRGGEFEVEILQGCGAGQGGSDVELSLGDQRIAFVVEDTGHFQNFKPRTVGRFTLSPGKHRLRVGATKIAHAATMDLRHVRLSPAPIDTYLMSFPPSREPNGLVYSVDYRLWIPDGVKTLRGVIIHQHGCGVGACSGGETAADDLHWRALAKKWDCALLAPRFHQQDAQDCRAWCDPRRGSEQALFHALTEFAKSTGHPELENVPWCLWGHSGGGFWASIMQTMHPDRIVAIWSRSGGAIESWKKGDVPAPEIPEAAYGVPVVCNPGVKEGEEERFRGAWTGARAWFDLYRAKGAPICLAPEPNSSHECGASRYLAIPFFDLCLEARLPPPGANDAKLRSMPSESVQLAAPLANTFVAAKDFVGDPAQSVWLPNERFARLWSAYVKDGVVPDNTPPPAPTNVTATKVDGGVEIAWNAAADLESGIKRFVILRGDQEIGSLPDGPDDTATNKRSFQTISYHDTPAPPTLRTRFVDKSPGEGAYRVIAINAVGLKSEPSPP